MLSIAKITCAAACGLAPSVLFGCRPMQMPSGGEQSGMREGKSESESKREESSSRFDPACARSAEMFKKEIEEHLYRNYYDDSGARDDHTPNQAVIESIWREVKRTLRRREERGIKCSAEDARKIIKAIIEGHHLWGDREDFEKDAELYGKSKAVFYERVGSAINAVKGALKKACENAGLVELCKGDEKLEKTFMELGERIFAKYGKKAFVELIAKWRFGDELPPLVAKEIKEYLEDKKKEKESK